MASSFFSRNNGKQEEELAELSRQDQEGMRKAAAEAMFANDLGTAKEMDVDGVREFFCEHWPMVKRVLQFLGDNIGGIVRWAVRGVIAAGDFLHGRICRG